jgi:hypothetical protein
MKKDSVEQEIKYVDRERAEISNTLSGNLVQAQVENSHPFMFGLPTELYFLNQASSLYRIDKSWNTLLKTDVKPKYLGFLGKNMSKLLPSSSFFAVKEKGKGKTETTQNTVETDNKRNCTRIMLSSKNELTHFFACASVRMTYKISFWSPPSNFP